MGACHYSASRKERTLIGNLGRIKRSTDYNPHDMSEATAMYWDGEGRNCSQGRCSARPTLAEHHAVPL